MGHLYVVHLTMFCQKSMQDQKGVISNNYVRKINKMVQIMAVKTPLIPSSLFTTLAHDYAQLVDGLDLCLSL